MCGLAVSSIRGDGFGICASFLARVVFHPSRGVYVLMFLFQYLTIGRGLRRGGRQEVSLCDHVLASGRVSHPLFRPFRVFFRRVVNSRVRNFVLSGLLRNLTSALCAVAHGVSPNRLQVGLRGFFRSLKYRPFIVVEVPCVRSLSSQGTFFGLYHGSFLPTSRAEVNGLSKGCNGLPISTYRLPRRTYYHAANLGNVLSRGTWPFYVFRVHVGNGCQGSVLFLVLVSPHSRGLVL